MMDLLELLNWAMRTDLLMQNIYYVAAGIVVLVLISSVVHRRRTRRLMNEKAKRPAEAAMQEPPRGPRPYYFNG